MAACGSPMWGMNQSGLRDGAPGRAGAPGEPARPYANMFFFNGGMGATMQRRWAELPVVAVQRVIDLGGDQRAPGAAAVSLQTTARGQRRGRAASRRAGQEILVESRSATPIAVSFLAERTVFPAFGIEGGEAGAPGALRINGKPRSIRSGNTSCSAATPSCWPRPAVAGTASAAARDPGALHDDGAAGYIATPTVTPTARTEPYKQDSPGSLHDDPSPHAACLRRRPADACRALACAPPRR